MSLISSKSLLMGVIGFVAVGSVYAAVDRAMVSMTNCERIPRNFQDIVYQALTEQLDQ